MRGNPDGAPSWSRSFSSQGRLSPTSLSTDLHAHTQTPVYTQVQLVSNSSVLCPVNQCDCIRENSNTDKSTFENIYKKNTFLKKKKIDFFLLLFSATDKREEWQYWQYAEDLETEDSTIRLRSASWQEHLFRRCFGTFSISSFLFHVIFSENNLSIISPWLSEKWQCSYFAAEIQALLWIVRAFSAETT